VPPRRSLALVLVALALGMLAGCGASRIAAPDLSRFQTPAGVEQASYLGGSLRFDAPANWASQIGSAPLVVTYASGPAIIAIWRYPRSKSQALPDDVATLEQARSALIGAAAARDRTLRVISAAVDDVHGLHAVELDAVETIRGQVRRVRSAHVYADGAELVVDEYAPESMFHDVDRLVFSPLLHSLRLGRVGGA
jgi:hypothetical protein